MEVPICPPAARVLLVEDCEVDSVIVRRLLAGSTRPEIALTCESSIAGALKRLQNQPFEACLVDLHLPDGSGLEVVRWLAEECPAIAVIIMTGDERPAADEEALIAGADYFLTKSEWSAPTLSRAVRYALAHRERVQAAWARRREATGKQDPLPICMECKKIRDSSNYWHALEAYLHQHAGLEFTHGYCPTCFQVRMAEVEQLFQTADPLQSPGSPPECPPEGS